MNENIGRLNSPYVFLIRSFFRYLLQSGAILQEGESLKVKEKKNVKNNAFRIY
jgi:hypothetical protein